VKDPRWLVCSLGDPAGIGPEILLHSAADWLREGRPGGVAVAAPAGLLREMARRWAVEVRIEEAGCLPDSAPNALLALGWPGSTLGPDGAAKWNVDQDREPGVVSGLVAWASLARAADVVTADPLRRALVTAPISKHTAALAGFRWPGHTEWLGERAGVPDPLMWMHSADLSVGLVSNHDPIAQVAEAVTPARVEAKLRLACAWLARRHPGEALVVLGLNPHAGDGGTLGGEEQEWLGPLVRRLAGQGLPVEGPRPADAALARGRGRFLAMYHDQGLPVFKLVAGMRGVNTTLGLPFVRTSPDHGTAFDLAGRGLADPGSMRAALDEAWTALAGRGAL
jgi:4-hydroxythreonine-4-phosphate dehydrogenase